MKSVITAICLLIPLVIIFVIIDRKDFYSGDDPALQQEALPEKTTMVTTLKPVEQPTETKQMENKPVEKKPATESKPVETKKPAESNPVTETKSAEVKPVETKPVAETKSVTEAKPVAETKPIETMLVAEENLAPAAIPVVMAAEAVKLNEEAKEYAIAEKEKREPFFKLYQNNKIDTICFEGTIRATSTIPDPTKNDYDNCLYALFVELDSVLSDVASDTKIPYEVIINTPIMKNKTILQGNKFLPGDKVWCTCADYDIMPQDIQEIQLSDDIQSYEHQQFYALTINKISAFQKGGNRNFAKREITILPIQSLPKDEKAAALRKERIQNEIARIEEEIQKHGGSFEKWKEEYKPISEKYQQLRKEDFKGWIGDSFFAVGGAETTSYKTKDYIDGILPYKKYLEENGIDLIVVRIPSKWDFAARVLASNDFQENPAWVEHYYECLKKDIEIIDPMPAMWEHRFDFPLFYFYNEPKELHPFEGQAFITAKVLSEALKRYDYLKTEHPLSLAKTARITQEQRFFWPEGNDKFNPQDNLSFVQVVQDEKPIGMLTLNTGSPFIFISNSFFYYPWRPLSASVPAYTAYFIQAIPDWFYQNALGNPVLKNLVMARELLHHRYAVIMVERSTDWTGTFLDFPQYLYDKPERMSLEKTTSLLSSDVVIDKNESYIVEKDESTGMVIVTHQVDNQEKLQDIASIGAFSFQIKIPALEYKQMCLLRINHKTNTGISFVLLDKETMEVIARNTIANNTNVHSDFYIPINNESRTALIQIRMDNPDSEYFVENIELWYY